MEDTEIANPLKYALSILDKPLFKELVSDSYNRIVAKNTIRIKPTILKEAEIEQVILELAIKEADKFIKQRTRLQFKYNGDTLILESKYDSFYDSLIIANLSRSKNAIKHHITLSFRIYTIHTKIGTAPTSSLLKFA